MTIDLSPEDTKKIEAMIAAGRYSTAEDALHAGLEAIEAEEDWKDYARDRISAGLDDIREGRTIPVEDFLEELQAMRQQKA